MKKILVVLLMVVSWAFSTTVHAKDIPITGRWTGLNNVYGDWYDTKGNLAMRIGSDNTINGQKVVKAFMAGYGINVFFATGGVPAFQVNGMGPIALEHHGEDYHEILIVGGGQMVLRKTKQPQYFESVGGVYLGMATDDLTALYGNPSSIDNSKAMRGKVVWKYEKEGFDVQIIGGNFVSKITIYSYGDRRFDRSGLSCNSSLEEFNEQYGLGGVERLKNTGGRGTAETRSIGHGERISFLNYPVSLTLTTSSHSSL